MRPPDTAVIQELGDRIKVRPAETAEAEAQQHYLEACNRPLADRALLEGLWQEASVRMYRAFYAGWLGFTPPSSISLRQSARAYLRRARGMLASKPSSGEAGGNSQWQHLLWHVLFACDSHNDAIATALGVLGGALEDRRTPETERLVDEMMPGPL